MSNKYITDRKAYRLEISEPGLRFVVIYMRTVQAQTSRRISRLGPATETKSDRFEFIVRPVSCKRIKRNVWRSIQTHASLSSSQSHVNSPLVKFEFVHSQNNISNYVAHTRNYLLHTYFCCHSETQENTSMLISMIFLYVTGVIFIYSRVEPSVYIMH